MTSTLRAAIQSLRQVREDKLAAAAKTPSEVVNHAANVAKTWKTRTASTPRRRR